MAQAVSIGDLFAEIGKVKEDYSAIVSEVTQEAATLAKMKNKLATERAKAALCKKTIAANIGYAHLKVVKVMAAGASCRYRCN